MREVAETKLVREEPVAFEEIAEVVVHDMSPVTEAALARRSLVSEEFRLLRSKVRAIAEERPFRCVGMLSAASAEGKTTTSLGLAMAAAQEPGRRVLLIEADRRRPAIASYLGLPPAPGLGEWLVGAEDVVPLRKLRPFGFHLLTAGHVGAEQPEQLGSTRMVKLVEGARRSFDFVVVDCPPLLPVADSVILQDLVDGFVFVVRARQSPRETILRAISHLKPDRIQGVVFNDYREILPRYYSYAYRHYTNQR